VWFVYFKLKNDDIQAFLEEATVLDPRFKSKMDRDEIWIPDLNLKWTGMKSGRGSGHQQWHWHQTQRQLRRHLNLTVPLTYRCCETFSSCSVVLTLYISSQAVRAKRDKGAGRRRDWRKRGGLRKFIVANCDEC